MEEGQDRVGGDAKHKVGVATTSLVRLVGDIHLCKGSSHELVNF